MTLLLCEEVSETSEVQAQDALLEEAPHHNLTLIFWEEKAGKKTSELPLQEHNGPRKVDATLYYKLFRFTY